MEYKQFENIKVRIYWEEDTILTYKNGGTKIQLYKGKVLFTDEPSIPFFSANKKQLNDMLRGFETLNKLRYGRTV